MPNTASGSGIESVVVTNTTNSEEVTADLRDTFFVARGLPLDNGSNTLTATATDRAGNEKSYPTSRSHTVTLDNTLSVTYTYDAAGNMTQKNDDGSTTTYTYDYDNQLTQITFPGSTSRWQKFYYDGLGRRVQIDYYKEGSPDPVLISRQKFVYLGASVIRELNEDGATVREYIRDGGLGGGIGSIIYCREGTYPNYLYYYFHYNHKGDMVSVTDGDRKEVAYYEYDAWGNIMTEAGTWTNPYGFATKERDYGIKDGEYEYKSGLIYFGARYYSPQMGRWTQRDATVVQDNLNLYLYVNGEPVNGTDAWGLRMRTDTSWICSAGWKPIRAKYRLRGAPLARSCLCLSGKTELTPGSHRGSGALGARTEPSQSEDRS